VNRRMFLNAFGSFALGAAAGIGGPRLLRWQGSTPRAVVGREKAAQPRLLALSLRSYQQALQASFEAPGLPTMALQEFGGLNSIHGFIVEAPHHVILFGEQVASLPAFDLDDVLVAFRSAYQAGPEYLHTAPGCTIDPRPGAADPWKIQIAQVLGMPATAPMGTRHIAIDYDMKNLAAGLTRIAAPSPAPTSVFDYARSRSALCDAGEAADSSSSVHRFWFCPLYPLEKPRYLQDERTVHIQHPVGVQLLTEQEFLRDGTRVGAAPPEAAAVEFTKSMTQVLGANDVPEYVRLRGDFRLVELGKLLRFRDIPPAALSYLLTDCPMREVPAPKWVGGVRRQESGEAICHVQVSEEQTSTGSRTSTSESIRRYRREFRGGVEVSVAVTAADFGKAGDRRLGGLYEDVLRSRPSPESVTWAVDSRNT
jgi:hypothetical protein